MEVCSMCSEKPAAEGLDCGHCLCVACAESMEACPKCRKRIKLLEKTEEPQEFIPDEIPFEAPFSHLALLEELQEQSSLYQKRLEKYKIEVKEYTEREERLKRLTNLGFKIPDESTFPTVPLIDFLPYNLSVCGKEILLAEKTIEIEPVNNMHYEGNDFHGKDKEPDLDGSDEVDQDIGTSRQAEMLPPQLLKKDEIRQFARHYDFNFFYTEGEEQFLVFSGYNISLLYHRGVDDNFSLKKIFNLRIERYYYFDSLLMLSYEDGGIEDNLNFLIFSLRCQKVLFNQTVKTYPEIPNHQTIVSGECIDTWHEHLFNVSILSNSRIMIETNDSVSILSVSF
jgi:hypothetical protein